MRMRYLTCCVDSTAEKIDAMREREREVTLRTIRKHVDPVELAGWARSQGYATERGERGVRLYDDWHVRYFKSVYDGQRCVFVLHSAIEHIFTERIEE